MTLEDHPLRGPIFEMDGRVFGVFRVRAAGQKPVVAKKDAGKGQAIKNGEIQYRYGGRTQAASGCQRCCHPL